MNYKIIASSVLVIAFFAFLIIAYIKYSSRNIENEKVEIGQSVLNAIKNDPELRPKTESKIDTTELNKDQVEQIVKEMIAKDPTLITNALDKIAAIKAEQEKEAIKIKIQSLSDNIYNNKNDPQIGSLQPRIKIVQFFDYLCGYCRRMQEINDSIIAANPDIAIIFKELPILSEASFEASKLALAVNATDPNHYPALHKALLSENINSNEDLIMIAKKVGIDTDKLNTFLRDEKAIAKITAQIQDNLKLASDIGLKGTPTYIISEINEVSAGATTVANMQQLIEKAKQNQSGSNSANLNFNSNLNTTKSDAIVTETEQNPESQVEKQQNLSKQTTPPLSPNDNQNKNLNPPSPSDVGNNDSTSSLPKVENKQTDQPNVEIPNPRTLDSLPPLPNVNIPQSSAKESEAIPQPQQSPLLPNLSNSTSNSSQPTNDLAPPPLPPISNR